MAESIRPEGLIDPVVGAGSARSGGATPLWLVLKRALDITVAAGLLLVLLPLLLAIAVAIKLDSPGPVFYRARRVGYRGNQLLMLKFRKMHADAAGAPLTADGDLRLTRLGALLTRTRLDEVPQFWDVLCGRMSLVGPRPESPGFVDHHAAAYREILRVRPGITGPSQIAFASERRILDSGDPVAHYLDRILPQKVGIDLLYTRRTCLRIDTRILFWTLAGVLLRREVSVNRETLQMKLRRRPQAAPPELPGSSQRPELVEVNHPA
jgi:lipopolysaccharide/colanic/teichoic acid biosynthesis glycosyltransferase